MKKILIAVCALVLGTGCKKEEKPDPAGTIPMSINSYADQYPVIIYQGAPDQSPGFTWNATYFVKLGMPTGQTVFKFDNIYVDEQNGYYYKTGDANCWVADIGAVDGLGYVEDKPTSGYAKSVTVTPGHGYVLKIKKNGELNSTTPDYYARVFVVAYAEDIYGGIIGADIKYQFPF